MLHRRMAEPQFRAIAAGCHEEWASAMVTCSCRTARDNPGMCALMGAGSSGMRTVVAATPAMPEMGATALNDWLRLRTRWACRAASVGHGSMGKFRGAPV